MKRKRSYETLPTSGEHPNPWLARIADERNPQNNRRRHARRAVIADMMVCQCVTCFGRWPVRDLSLGGAYVEIPRRGMLVGMAVDVALQFRLHGTTIERRLFAQVARVGDTGIAVAFNQCTPEVHADLVSLLNS
ncbi:MAG TPA: PilZ domain-containing protein [Acidiferrobacterales bacterium]